MKKHGRLLTLILALALSVLMLVSASGLEIFIVASSDEYESYTTSAKYLEAIDVMKGYDDGSLHLEEPILRYQAALFFARVLTGVTEESFWGEGASAEFKDVPQYGPVIDMIADMEVIRGYGNSLFGYNDRIRYQDMCAMLVRILGYETEEMIKAYPHSYVFKVKELGLDLNNVQPADYLNRGQTAQMVYDALVTEIKDNDTSERDKILAEIIMGNRNDNTQTAPTPDVTKDTYLERNFEVSSTMYFEIVATENYSASNSYKAEEGYITAVQLTQDRSGALVKGSTWNIPVEGAEVNGVTEIDLIGKCLTLVFDDKDPTSAKLEDEECAIVHAEIVGGIKFENLGELSFVKFDETKAKLTLGTKTVKVADLEANNTVVWQYGTKENNVVNTMTLADFASAIEKNTYFSVDCYDFDRDGDYDSIVYKPYTFGQYAQRTYNGKTYTMVGQYSEIPVYDVTSSAEKTADNRTYFVEYFLGKAPVELNTASKSFSNYRPGDTSLRIGETLGEYSLAATVTGDEIKTGDFMIYYYNTLLGKLEVIENLGSYQVGALSGIKSAAKTYTIDGSSMSVGIPGAIADNTGVLVGEGAYNDTVSLARAIMSNYEAGSNNVKYLEYDGKLIYLESYADSEIVVGSNYVIVDVAETFDQYLEKDEDAVDLPLEENAVLVLTLDPATGNFNEIKVESVTYVDGNGASATYSFFSIAEKQNIGLIANGEIRNFFESNGVIYASEDSDDDGYLELYAYGTSDFNVVGAKLEETTAPQIFFNYNKSNAFVADNQFGISTDRITVNSNTVAVIVGQDGYIMHKGELGNNTSAEPYNELHLSGAAMVLVSSNEQLTIFDPVGYVAADASSNVYNKYADSVWNVGNTDTNAGVKYYLFIASTKFGGSAVMEDSDGATIKNDKGEILYSHEYQNLYNLVTGQNETVTLITTSIDAPATEIINSVKSVIRYEEEKNDAKLTTFGEVFVDNGDYRYGGFAWLASKEKISFSTQAKDEDGNGVITGDEGIQSLVYNSESDKIYNALDSLSVTFIDLDAGAGVDPDEFSFSDAYVFYNDNDDQRKAYSSVTLEDRVQGVDYPAGTFPVKRHVLNAKDVTSNIGNGKITALTGGKDGLIGSAGFMRWNGWCDYLIPAVNEYGDTVWSYEGSARVQVTYYAYIDYDADANTVDAVVVRVGKLAGVVGAGTDVPTISDVPTDPKYNFTTEND